MEKSVTDVFQNNLDSMLGGEIDTPDEKDDWQDRYDKEESDTRYPESSGKDLDLC